MAAYYGVVVRWWRLRLLPMRMNPDRLASLLCLGASSHAPRGDTVAANEGPIYQYAPYY